MTNDIYKHSGWKRSGKAVKKFRMFIRKCLQPFTGDCKMGVDVPYRKCCGRDGSDSCHYYPTQEKNTEEQQA